MSDDLGSEAESAPPAPNGHAVPVAAVAGPQHPVWQRAAGGPPPPPTKHTATTRPGTTTTVNGRFVPISMVALELRARNEFDGASSVGSEPRHARERQQQHNNKKRTRPRGGDADDSEEEEAARDDGTSSRMRDECDDFDPLDDDANDEVHDDGSEAASGADVVANAAFGGGQKKKAKRRSGATTTALSVASDTESASSSQRRNAHCRAFPVPGVECVGCALPAKVTPVDDFVRSSCDKMQESALFKMSALVYQQKVAEPALAEGVHVPAWAYVGASRTHLTAPRRPRPHPPLAARAQVEGHTRPLHHAPHGCAHAAVREHADARGDAQDPRAHAPPRGRGVGRARPRQDELRTDYEDNHATVQGNHAAARDDKQGRRCGGGCQPPSGRGRVEEARLAARAFVCVCVFCFHNRYTRVGGPRVSFTADACARASVASSTYPNPYHRASP